MISFHRLIVHCYYSPFPSGAHFISILITATHSVSNHSRCATFQKRKKIHFWKRPSSSLSLTKSSVQTILSTHTRITVPTKFVAFIFCETLPQPKHITTRPIDLIYKFGQIPAIIANTSSIIFSSEE